MTGKELFSISLDLLGIKMPDGTIPQTAFDLQSRALPLINILLNQNAKLESLIKKIDTPPIRILTLDDTLKISDKIANRSLPFGLAAMLISTEDNVLAGYMHTQYITETMNIKSELPATLSSITKIY